MSHLLHPVTPSSPIPPGDLLHRTVGLLEQAVLGGPDHPATAQLVAVVLTPDGIRIGLRPMAGDPLTELEGFTAPPSWWAIGLVGPGEARPLDDPTAGGWPVDVIHLVARTGESASAHHHRGDPPGLGIVETGDGTGWAGLVDDHLRRSLGLATMPAPGSTQELWTARWLDDLAERAGRGQLAGAPWLALATRHPAAVLAAEAGAPPEVLAWTAAEIGRAAEILTRTWTWELLRASARSGRDVLGTTAPPVAAWMDDGTFARRHLARYPSAVALLDLLEAVLDRPNATRLRATCRAWSIQT